MSKVKKKQLQSCSVKYLPDTLRVNAAWNAISINPANAIMDTPITDRLAVLIARYWGVGGVKLGVRFMDTSNTELKNRILSHMNAYTEFSNVTFAESAQGEVRIARQKGGGYWSYLGTDILQIGSNQATMNLDSFTANTAESEYLRVVRHETGHTLGFPHEHLRRELVAKIDRQKAIAYFRNTYGWTEQDTVHNVLTPLEEISILGSVPTDPMSIMAYQLPGSIMKDGKAIPGGSDFSATDKTFANKLYPKKDEPPPPPPEGKKVKFTFEYDTATGKVSPVTVS